MMPESLNEPVGQTPTIRRSFTLPTKLNPLSQRGSGAPKLSENVIFYHPSAKIVHFAPKALAPVPSSSAPTDFDYPVDTIETLPWRSATERTVATAPLRLERVHGLTAFLKCGNVVHAILKNSQCWCVDGVSKFVLRIRPLTYYRIEIPNETDEDKGLVGDLKAALPTILRYEVTPCPFKRAFTVELPEEAMAPRRKKAWRPKQRKDSLFPASGSSQGSPSETRSEWLDSASTGEDTDGAATDDSALIPKRINSASSDAPAVADGSPTSTDNIEFPSPPKPIRRSVTETPQTFTSLLAKFDASPVPEEEEAPESTSVDQEPTSPAIQGEPIPIPEVKIEPADESTDSQVDEAVAQQGSIPASAPQTKSVAESVAILESNKSTIPSQEPNNALSESQVVPIASREPEIEDKSSSQVAATDEPGLEVSASEMPAYIPETPQDTVADTKLDAAPASAVEAPLSENEASLDSPATLDTVNKPELEALPESVTASEAASTPKVVSVPQPNTAPEVEAPSTSLPSHQTEAESDPASVPLPQSDNIREIGSAPTNQPASRTLPVLEINSAANAPPASPPTPEHVPIPETKAETDYDHDPNSSFSSTPESFHSVDPSSPSDSVSTHTPPAEAQHSEAYHFENKENVPPQPKSLPSNPVTQGFAPQVDGSSNRHVPLDTDRPIPQPKLVPTTSPSREEPTKSSLAIPSVAKPSSTVSIKSSPPTDFSHMSSEFRRRSKATRERDVSPMPPASAIYQPKAGDDASSFLSKALTLVLVPPVTLFIVLLHVAARIVISPALNSAQGDSNQGSRPSGKQPVTEDDFSFPLERESSSEYEDAEINKKLDPWDLD